MGYRAHVQTRHEIEYGNCHFNFNDDIVVKWLRDNGVYVCGGEEYGTGSEWEMLKDELRSIPESAYVALHDGKGYGVTGDELRKFVKDCLAAPTGDYAYISWF